MCEIGKIELSRIGSKCRFYASPFRQKKITTDNFIPVLWTKFHPKVNRKIHLTIMYKVIWFNSTTNREPKQYTYVGHIFNLGVNLQPKLFVNLAPAHAEKSTGNGTLRAAPARRRFSLDDLVSRPGEHLPRARLWRIFSSQTARSRAIPARPGVDLIEIRLRWGGCYDHNFRDFCQFLGDKNGVFLKKCCDKIFAKAGSSLNKKRKYLCQFFRRKYLKNRNIGSRKKSLWTNFLSEYYTCANQKMRQFLIKLSLSGAKTPC
jgi:hypothetical protein